LPCFAGNISAPEVSITVNSATSQTAIGSLQGAAFSNDSVQRIGCSIKAERMRIGGTRLTADCLAIDEFGAQASCSSVDARLLESVATISSTSIISFTTDSSYSSSDTCRIITVENTSAAM
jgi:hypothetical protein